LNLKIWKNLKDHKKINKATCSKTQLKEISMIENIFINYIKSLDKEQRCGQLNTAKNGYTVIRYCNQDSRCKSKWLFKVNVPSGQAEIHFLKLCDHI
jgi:hypothetical protein